VYCCFLLNQLVLHVIGLLPNTAKLNQVDNIIASDSGQGSFKCYVKFVLWFENETHELMRFCAEIKCPKDTYDVLSKAWADPINKAIEKMIGTGKIAMGMAGL